jgi:hypothetical protein
MSERSVLNIDGPSFPFAALVIASCACAALAAILWWIGTAPCGWGPTPELSGSCSESPIVIGPLITVPSVVVGAVVSRLKQRWWPFFVGLGLTFGPLVATWLALWQFPFE